MPSNAKPRAGRTAAPTAVQAVAIGQALRARRKALRISMVAAAEAAGISRVTWHRLEKGEGTVAWGSLLAAAAVLDLELGLVDPGEPAGEPARDPGECLPLRIVLDDYPQLRRLAWQLGEQAGALSPREALGLYERNWRHVDRAALSPRERALIRALRITFGGDPDDI
jgi:transcriptional regulator with XRE-family HTH domain